MREDEHQPDVADLAVELQQRVLAERRGHGPEASHERELEAHHRQPGESKRDGEVRPEVMVRPAGADDRKHERRHDHAQVDDRGDDRPRHERHARPLSHELRDSTRGS